MLSASDINWISADSARAMTRSTDITSEVAPGWVARRPIHTGDILRPPSVSKPDLVTTGETVDVVYADTGIKLTLKGTAIGDGKKGDEVYVRLETRKRLRAIVIDDHTVRIVQ
jgi:flagella basal body P-ring formation protein FlgA